MIWEHFLLNALEFLLFCRGAHWLVLFLPFLFSLFTRLVPTLVPPPTLVPSQGRPGRVQSLRTSFFTTHCKQSKTRQKLDTIPNAYGWASAPILSIRALGWKERPSGKFEIPLRGWRWRMSTSRALLISSRPGYQGRSWGVHWTVQLDPLQDFLTSYISVPLSSCQSKALATLVHRSDRWGPRWAGGRATWRVQARRKFVAAKCRQPMPPIHPLPASTARACCTSLRCRWREALDEWEGGWERNG